MPYFERDYRLPALRDPRLNTTRNLGWDLGNAAAFLVKHLELNKSAAADVITEARTGSYSRGRNRSFVYQVFEDLDAHLFAGKLRDVVYLQWTSLGQDVCGATYIPGVIAPRITIQLNADLHRFANQDDMLSSLIHQMIHAYYLTTCKPPDKSEPDHRLTHDEHFGKIMNEMKDLSALDSVRPLPLAFGHNLYRQYTSRTRRWNDCWPDETDIHTSAHHCSNCHASLKNITKAEIDAWYHDKCTPRLIELELSPSVYEMTDKGLGEIPRTEAGPREEWVELVWQGRPVQTKRSKVESHPSFTKHFRDGKRVLGVPDVPEKAFRALYDFLNDKTYGPDLSATQDSGSRPGPPRIEKLIEEWPTYLHTDVCVHKLAKQLSFDELARHALHRLNHQALTHEDPVAVLAAICTPGAAPDRELREWAQAFLQRHTPPTPLASPLGTSNIHKLTHDPLLHGPFAGLRAESAELRRDPAAPPLPPSPPPLAAAVAAGGHCGPALLGRYAPGDGRAGAFWPNSVYSGGPYAMLPLPAPPPPPQVEPPQLTYGEWEEGQRSGTGWTPPKLVEGRWQSVSTVTGDAVVHDGVGWRRAGGWGRWE